MNTLWTPNIFFLYEIHDSKPHYFIMNDHAETGKFQISNLNDSKELFSMEKSIEMNKKEYFRCENELSGYIANRDPQLLPTTNKIDIRIEYFRQVRARYIEWFLRNGIPITNETMLERIARKNSIDTEGIDLSKCNDRMLTTIKLLAANPRNIIKGSELLIRVDAELNTRTSYHRVSEVFKSNRDLYHRYIEVVEKGIYKLNSN